jgi:beta-glucuronidase
MEEIMKIVFSMLMIMPLVVGLVHGKQANLITNPEGRSTVSLNGKWQIIIDLYENGFYNYRYDEDPNGYFNNAKPKDKSDRVEYDFDTSEQLDVPGDWNSQMEKLFLYEGTVWYKKSFDFMKQT